MQNMILIQVALCAALSLIFCQPSLADRGAITCRCLVWKKGDLLCSCVTTTHATSFCVEDSCTSKTSDLHMSQGSPPGIDGLCQAVGLWSENLVRESSSSSNQRHFLGPCLLLVATSRKMFKVAANLVWKPRETKMLRGVGDAQRCTRDPRPTLQRPWLVLEDPLGSGPQRLALQQLCPPVLLPMLVALCGHEPCSPGW